MLNRGVVRLKSLKIIRKLLGEGKHSALIQTVCVPAVCHKRTGWRRSRLTPTLFPHSSNLSNQPNALPPKFPYLCMQYTPINTHSGMPTYYGGPPSRHGRSATVVTRPARYCFLSPVRSLARDSNRSDSHPCPWPNADEQKQKQNCSHLRFACVFA